MPTFYFDLYDGETATRDAFGTELASAEEAADQAAALLPDVAREALPGGDARDFAAFVSDENGAPVYRAALLFRGQRLDGSDAPPAPLLPPTADLIGRTRETRETVRRLSAEIAQGVSDLLTLIGQGVQSVEADRWS